MAPEAEPDPRGEPRHLLAGRSPALESSVWHDLERFGRSCKLAAHEVLVRAARNQDRRSETQLAVEVLAVALDLGRGFRVADRGRPWHAREARFRRQRQ